MMCNQMCNRAGFALTAVVAGIVLMLALGFAKDPNEGEKEILPRNTFGDLRIVTTPVDQSDTEDAMVVYKGDSPIILLYRNDSNEIDRVALTNGENRPLALGRLTRSGLSEFAVFGNAVHESRRARRFST